MNMKYNRIIVPLIAVFALACGGGESEETSPPPKAAQKSTVEKEPSNSGKQTVEITLGSNDQMQYEQKEIKVPANSTVKLTLVHNGTMPKQAMGHNFVLLEAGTDIAAFGAEAAAAGIDKEHIPDSDAIIAHTGLIGGGESTTVTFEAPATGSYDFICSFPGHYALMKGKLIVD